MPSRHVRSLTTNVSYGMKTSKWGPILWDILMSTSHDMEQRPPCDALLHSTFQRMWSSLRYMLPCKYCRQSYRVYYKTYWTPEIRRYVRWTHFLHNLVNKKLHKPQLSWKSVQRTFVPLTPTEFRKWFYIFSFVVCLNYKPSKHRHYRVWWNTWETLRHHLPTLQHLPPLSPTSRDLQSKYTLLRWLTRHFQQCLAGDLPHFCSFIAIQDPDTLFRTCQPLFRLLKRRR